MITIKDLKKAIDGLPDDMVVIVPRSDSTESYPSTVWCEPSDLNPFWDFDTDYLKSRFYIGYTNG